MPESRPSPQPATVDDRPSSLPLRAEAAEPVTEPMPTCLGRYRVLARLGAGGFGVVYRGRDDELQRDVAIKVPHRHRVASAEDLEAYLAEARILAGLRHPGLVPVHDLGRTEDGLCYVVYEFIEGCDLRARLKEGRLAFALAAELAAGPTWPISGWPCGRRISARELPSPARPRT
jgi:serine/threonine protein kinase